MTMPRLSIVCAALALFMLTLAPAPVGAQAIGPSHTVILDGPPPPAPPATMSRDAAGKVTMRAVRVTQPMSIDGQLDEAVYRDVPPAGGFLQQEPREGVLASDRTDVWIFYDDRNLYVAARCYQDPAHPLVATEMRRDSQSIYNNDHVAVLIDTFYDRRNGYFFTSTPLGALFDAQITDERDINTNWNTLWSVATGRFEGGWSVEFAIPFKSVRFKEDGAVWGVNFRRRVVWRNETSFLSQVPAALGRRGLTKVSSAGTLVGIEPPKHLRNFDIKPYTIGSIATDRRAAAPYANRGTGDIGVDAKYGLTQGLIADVTYNTDFAQVEDDEQQVNLTRFSVLFPEKREFFLEGQGTFQFGGPGGSAPNPNGPPAGGFNQSAKDASPIVFFSRRIGLDNGREVPIIAGGRLNGRAGRYAIGALDIRTGDQADAGAMPTDFSALRIKRDVLRRSNIGLIATRRSPAGHGSGSNAVGGLDGTFGFFDNLTLSSYWVKSSTPGRTGDAASYRGRFDYAGDRYGVLGEHLVVGTNFDPEIGFLRRSAFRREYAQARFSPRLKSSRRVRKLTWEGSTDLYENRVGTLESRETIGTFRVEFNSSDQWDAQIVRNYENLPASFSLGPSLNVPVGAYRFEDYRTTYTFGPQRRISGTMTLAHGTFYGGHKTEATWRGRVEMQSRFYLEPTLSVNQLDLPYGSYTARLMSTRATLTLTPRMLLAALVQFNSRTTSVSTNARFRWEYQPGSELFIVYSEGRDTLAGGFPELDNRSFVVKATKLLRF